MSGKCFKVAAANLGRPRNTTLSETDATMTARFRARREPTQMLATGISFGTTGSDGDFGRFISSERAPSACVIKEILSEVAAPLRRP